MSEQNEIPDTSVHTPTEETDDVQIPQFNTTFENTVSEESDYFGACLLPVRLDTVEDDQNEKHLVPFVLLAQDARSKKLTVLGGRPDAADKNEPLVTACREAHEESIGAMFQNASEGVKQLSAMNEHIIHFTYTKLKKPYHAYIVPSVESEVLLALFNDRRKELDKTGTVEYMGDTPVESYSEKIRLVWFPIQAAKTNHKAVCWFTRQIVADMETAAVTRAKKVETQAQDAESSSSSTSSSSSETK